MYRKCNNLEWAVNIWGIDDSSCSSTYFHIIYPATVSKLWRSFYSEFGGTSASQLCRVRYIKNSKITASSVVLKIWKWPISREQFERSETTRTTSFLILNFDHYCNMDQVSKNWAIRIVKCILHSYLIIIHLQSESEFFPCWCIPRWIKAWWASSNRTNATFKAWKVASLIRFF